MALDFKFYQLHELNTWLLGRTPEELPVINQFITSFGAGVHASVRDKS